MRIMLLFFSVLFSSISRCGAQSTTDSAAIAVEWSDNFLTNINKLNTYAVAGNCEILRLGKDEGPPSLFRRLLRVEDIDKKKTRSDVQHEYLRNGEVGFSDWQTFLIEKGAWSNVGSNGELIKVNSASLLHNIDPFAACFMRFNHLKSGQVNVGSMLAAINVAACIDARSEANGMVCIYQVTPSVRTYVLFSERVERMPVHVEWRLSSNKAPKADKGNGENYDFVLDVCDIEWKRQYEAWLPKTLSVKRFTGRKTPIESLVIEWRWDNSNKVAEWLEAEKVPAEVVWEEVWEKQEKGK